MGYKCPVCREDFKLDKNRWEKHIKLAHQGAGEDIINLIKKIAEPTNGMEGEGE